MTFSFLECIGVSIVVFLVQVFIVLSASFAVYKKTEEVEKR